MKSPWDNMDDAKNIFLKKSKNNFFLPVNFSFSIKTMLILIFTIVVIWLLSGVYKVNEGEEAIVIRFGEYVRKAYPGLNYHLPHPLEKVIIERVKMSRQTEVGYSSGQSRREANTSNGNYMVYSYRLNNRTINNQHLGESSTMLTGDENIVELNCNVRWHIKDLYSFVFNVAFPDETVKIVAESAIREVISETPIASILSNQKQEIADKIEKLIQQILNQYSIGIEIEKVQLLKAEPPSEVIDAYRDVQTSRADKEREINQAQAYRNDKIPEARGKAAKLIEEAKGYKQATVSKALGEAQKFNAILVEYKLNKEITKERLYLNTIETILQGSKKIIISDESKLLPHMGISLK
ncbi:FtsH protease activity modulator HflK [Orientia tsutsugamushi]|uniref:Protein HflK n=1 Tax=Orientia tsutsugamushi TaxID=784 RepID=A0A2U3QV27_ORITS|nr:FtsH protease activity modulator HflK [Orientia tsutsugamushi]SPR04835.1 HflK protein [Orientia tsutsugamushi]